MLPEIRALSSAQCQERDDRPVGPAAYGSVRNRNAARNDHDVAGLRGESPAPVKLGNKDGKKKRDFRMCMGS